MIAGPALKRVRKQIGLRWVDVAQELGVHWRTVARWEASPMLSRRVELKIQRVLWRAARERSFQDVCHHCHGAGLVPKPDAPAVLPRIPLSR